MSVVAARGAEASPSDVFSLHRLGLPREEVSEPRLGRTNDLLIQRPNERIER